MRPTLPTIAYAHHALPLPPPCRPSRRLAPLWFLRLRVRQPLPNIPCPTPCRPSPPTCAATASCTDAPEEKREFDVRMIAYVGLPALVLIGQLFFTFSRDALGDTALQAAVMDLYL